MGKLVAVVVGLLGVAAIFILLSLLFIKLGWYLFMVPVFGLPDLTWLQALGFSFLAASFRGSSVAKKE